MNSVLAKIFARGFYRAHSGFLVFFFVMIASYCLFINTAGDIKLLSPAQVVYYHFMVLINFIISPTMTAMFFVAFLAYNIKSWLYVSAQLHLAEHQFLFYGLPAYNWSQRFESWCYVALLINLPVVVYSFISAIIGIVMHHALMALLIMFYSLIMIALSAFIYTKNAASYLHEKGNSWVTIRWRKPYFSLFTYYVFDRLKLLYLLSKILSFLLDGFFLIAFADLGASANLAGLLVLCMLMANAMLIYHQHKFEQRYLTLSRNFAYRRVQLYLGYLASYIVILLPELLFLILHYGLIEGIGFAILMLCLAMFFHTILYRTAPVMSRYLPFLLVAFIGISLFILWGLLLPLAGFCLVLSFMLFYSGYYNYKIIIK